MPEPQNIMSPRTHVNIRSLILSVVGIALTGCNSVARREVEFAAAVQQPVSARLVANTSPTRSATKQPESWQMLKTQREAAERQAVTDAKQTRSLQQASFEQTLWTSEEPTPLVASEAGPCPECLPWECPSECGCPELCFGCDCDDALSELWCDAKGVWKQNNLLILAAAGGIAVGMREGDVDREVREEIAESPRRWGGGSQFLGKLGDVRYQAPVLFGVYGYSLWSQNEELHAVVTTTMSAMVITGVSTTALKLVTNTDRPSKTWANGEYGFPSYHTASTFAVAAVLDEYYGGRVGVPAYALAAAVGFSRLDEQDHDLSDVLFGGALGFVIGKAVAGRHLCGNSEIQIAPYFHPTDGTPGIALETSF